MPTARAPAVVAEAAPAEAPALVQGGSDWASVLFSDQGTGGRRGGTDWAQTLFS